MARSNGWLRLYNRMIDSPEILELNDSEFRFIVSMWCLASLGGEGGIIRYSIKALRRRIMPDKTEEEILEMIEHLKELDLLIEENGYFKIPRWEVHQYKYEEKEEEDFEEKKENPNKRKEYLRNYMKIYRKRKQSVNTVNTSVNNVNTPVNTSVNTVNVYASSNNLLLDTETESETEKENINNNIIPTSNDESKPCSKGRKNKKYSDKAKEEKNNGKITKYLDEYGDIQDERVKKWIEWLDGTKDLPYAVVPKFLEPYRKIKST